jgi:hypothetical protein
VHAASGTDVSAARGTDAPAERGHPTSAGPPRDGVPAAIGLSIGPGGNRPLMANAVKKQSPPLVVEVTTY